ncbi:hypothetical protein MKEN_01196000 [Mycena kentingensis (nom. inval.)]|nr:hypothetical protein MKEN_01196000 [Mycena kentingensis (nom. inval.)]
MSSWTQTGLQPHRIFHRPLGVNECGFLYDSKLNGTADTFGHSTLHASNPSIFTLLNVSRAYRLMKRRFPLLAATIDFQDAEPRFSVYEERLDALSFPGEVTVSSVDSADAAQALAQSTIAHGKRQLSDQLLARILVLSRTDEPHTGHCIVNFAHIINDGVSTGNFLNAFLELLATDESGPPPPDIETRLALSVSAESLVPVRFSVPRQRWRRAAGKIVSQIQDAKRQGGQTLPRRFGYIACSIPARSGLVHVRFSREQTSLLLQSCRKHRLTVGNVLPVLAQISLARLLCRRFLRGEISAEEWEFRRRQPSHTAGPINLRPYLDRKWFEAGGSDNVSVYIGYFYFTSGFTPLPRLQPGDALPGVTDIMSTGRFLLRCNKMKDLAAKYLRHPLFFEIGEARLMNKVVRLRELVKRETAPSATEVEQHNVSPMEQADYGTVMSHGWSTFGNTKMKKEYPSSKPGAATLTLVNHNGQLHCRTGELYLGSGSSDGQLFILVYYDTNVFADEVVQEWLTGIEEAASLYLADNVLSKL